MQRHFADIVIYVAFCNIKGPNGFLLTQRQMTLKHRWV